VEAQPPTPVPEKVVVGGRTVRSGLAFNSGQPTLASAPLVAALGAPADESGSPVSAEELARLMDDPRAAEVYWPELVKFASPQAKKIQKTEHTSFIPIFMKPAKIDAGKAFLAEHSRDLAGAQRTYGVLPQDVVSILMWESNLGKATGKFRVVNVYLGEILYVDEAAVEAERANQTELNREDQERHSKRLERIKRNAQKYLVAMLRSCKAKGVDPLSITGSWGGAIGFPQFMPTSFRFAADGNGDGSIDLYSFPDAIASIANYLSKNGYRSSRSRSFHAYNPEDEYVRGVQMYADAIAKR
jgi:membrane-bound lytic murein transglycosylase B